MSFNLFSVEFPVSLSTSWIYRRTRCSLQFSLLFWWHERICPSPDRQTGGFQRGDQEDLRWRWSPAPCSYRCGLKDPKSLDQTVSEIFPRFIKCTFAQNVPKCISASKSQFILNSSAMWTSASNPPTQISPDDSEIQNLSSVLGKLL